MFKQQDTAAACELFNCIGTEKKKPCNSILIDFIFLLWVANDVLSVSLCLTKFLDIALVKNNALVGAKIAAALSQLRQHCSWGNVLILYWFVNDNSIKIYFQLTLSLDLYVALIIACESWKIAMEVSP